MSESGTEGGWVAEERGADSSGVGARMSGRSPDQLAREVRDAFYGPDGGFTSAEEEQEWRKRSIAALAELQAQAERYEGALARIGAMHGVDSGLHGGRVAREALAAAVPAPADPEEA